MTITTNYGKFPMSQVVKTENELERRLYNEELRLSVKGVKHLPAIITLNLKNGEIIHVARHTHWDATKRNDISYVQILNDTCTMELASTTYEKGDSFVLTDIAAAIIYINNHKIEKI